MKKVLILLFIIGGLFMLRPVDSFMKNTVGNIIYRRNLATGIIKVVNNNKSFDVEIANSGKTQTRIFTLSPDPDLAVDDKVRILYNGPDDPIILAPTKLAVPPILEGWNLFTATYDNKSKYVRDKENTPFSMRFSSDGTKMYIVGSTTGTVYQYTLGTAWDISTVVYSGKSFPVYNEVGMAFGMSFNGDGTKMYILDYYKIIYQYTLTTAWDVSSAGYDSKFKNVASELSSAFDIYIKSDGTKLYVIGYGDDKVIQYTLNTPYDISTAAYNGKFLYVHDEDDYPFDLSFKADGTQIFVVGGGGDKVYHYNISTPWDLSTASYDDVSFALSGQSIGNPRCIFFKPDGFKMYVLNYTNYTIYQYSLESK